MAGLLIVEAAASGIAVAGFKLIPCMINLPVFSDGNYLRENEIRNIPPEVSLILLSAGVAQRQSGLKHRHYQIKCLRSICIIVLDIESQVKTIFYL
jgi:hypothetical protein